MLSSAESTVGNQSLGRQRKLLEVYLGLWTRPKGLVVGEGGRHIDELALHIVLVLDDELVVGVEGPESIVPVFDGHVGLLVRLYLSKQFLQ